MSHQTAISRAKTAEVSRSAAAGAIGPWSQTQRMSRYDAIDANPATTVTTGKLATS
ncbi:MAG: hypothetical protein ACKOUS_20425 [Alphaproteobacteria bacterium]